MSVRIAIPVPTSHDLEYNLRSWPMYAAAVGAAGGQPVRLDLDAGELALTREFRECHGVLLPGSPADWEPARYGREREQACAPADAAREAADRLLLEEAARAEKPVLGICFGVQSLNVWCGGTLVQDLSGVPVNHEAGSKVAVAHAVSVEHGSRMAGLVDASEGRWADSGVKVMVNSSHHQAVEQVGAGLRVTAVSAQDGVIEAIEGVDLSRFVLGVQWHPERSVEISATSRAIFAGFVAAAAGWDRSEAVQAERHPDQAMAES